MGCSPSLDAAIRTVEQLEQRRETVAAMIHDAETSRSKIVLAAATGNEKAIKEAKHLSGELAKLVTDANDIALALTMARDQLKAAQAEADAEAQDEKAARAAVLGIKAVELAKKADKHLAEVAAILTQCADLHRQVIKLGQLSDINSRRLANPRVIEQALINAGLKPFVPSIGAAIAVPPRALADSYRALCRSRHWRGGVK